MILDLFNESAIFDMDDSAVNESLEPEIANAVAAPIQEGENIFDAYYRITLENTKNFNNIMNTVAVREMQYMEQHGTDEPMYEAVDVKKFGSTIVGYVKAAWEKIKGLFQKAIDAISKIFSRDLVRDYEEAVKAKKVSPALKVKVKKGVKINGIVESIPTKVDNVISASLGELLVDSANISKDEASKKVSEWKEGRQAALNNMRAKVIAAFSGVAEPVTAKDFGSKLTQAVSTKIEGEVEITIAEAYAHFKTDITVKELRKAFKTTEKTYNEFMKEAKKIGKKAKVDDNTTVMTIEAMNVSVIKDAISVLNATSHQIIKLASKQQSMYKAILSKAVPRAAKEKKDDKKKSTNESADLICDLI